MGRSCLSNTFIWRWEKAVPKGYYAALWIGR